MNSRFQNIVKDYLTFSAKERTGLIVFLVLGLGIYFFSRYYSSKKPVPDPVAFQQELAHVKISIDSSPRFTRNNRENLDEDYSQPKRYESKSFNKGELFAFDPNTLDAEGWKKLGLRDKTITTIQNFVAKGYRFRQPDDLHKVYGLRKEDADRLMPFVTIKAAPEAAGSEAAAKPAYAKSIEPEPKKVMILDVNMADSAAFVALPGIGTRLAFRIINFREKLGGFSTVNQLSETYGLPDSTFQLIKSRLTCINPALKTININTADVNMLRAHPYLRWNIANAIINYRTQHGNYKSIDDLRKIDIITDELYAKIAPYLTL